MLEVKNLKKSYGDIEALKGISFSVEKGIIFGLLGPNGAGKTTTFNIISTLFEPDEGSLFYDGNNIFENKSWWREKIGYVPQELAIYDDLTGYENVMLMASLYGLSKKEVKDKCVEFFEKIGLKERMGEKVKHYSGGMKKRLNLIMGLIHDPEVILLDEPTAGIDVQTKIKIYQFIDELIKEGKTILYTTHMLKEAEDIFHIVGIIDEGILKALGSVEYLVEKFAPENVVELSIKNGKDNREFLNGIGDLSEDFSKLTVKVNNQNEIPSLIEKLLSEKIFIGSISIKKASLETVFLNLTGKELRD